MAHDPDLPLAEVLKRMKALNKAERERKQKGGEKKQALERKEIPRGWSTCGLGMDSKVRNWKLVWVWV